MVIRVPHGLWNSSRGQHSVEGSRTHTHDFGHLRTTVNTVSVPFSSHLDLSLILTPGLGGCNKTYDKILGHDLYNVTYDDLN